MCLSACLSVAALAALEYVYTAKQHAVCSYAPAAEFSLPGSCLVSFQHKLINPGIIWQKVNYTMNKSIEES